MCGIAGIVGTGLSGENLQNLATLMANRQAHRGPDDSGVWVDSDNAIALSHRRLAIHDLSPLGAQPMESSTGNLIIVFNGEIYNFTLIKEKLIQEGCFFKGTSDTEVLLTAIEHWGLERALEISIGMFALAVFDKRKKTLSLARDRIGEKPLYYGVLNENFLFASELKSITAANTSQRLDIDHSALASYLKYGYISAPKTIYNNIKKLEPGNILAIDLNSPINSLIHNESKPYWSLDTTIETQNPQKIKDEVLATTQLDTILNNVISEQALSDVPLGAFLSGGVDSSVVASILQSQKSTPIDTFTIGFYEKSFNEAEHAKSIAKHIGSSHQELYIDAKDTLSLVPSLSDIYDEPFSDASQIPMLIVSKLARQKVTVCLSGDGGDELFCGYNRYTQTQAIRTKCNALPTSLRSLSSHLIEGIPPSLFDKAYALAYKSIGKKGAANIGAKLHKVARIASMKNNADTYDYLSSYWTDPEQLLLDPFETQTLSANQNFEDFFLDAAMEWDQKWYLPGDNLVKTDRASMASSLELRVPLLDLRVLEFSWRISNQLKFKNGESKWLLKQVLYKYVPKHLIERPKMGFSIPIGHWLRRELRDWAETLLDKQFLDTQGLFNVDKIHSTWGEHIRGSHDHSNKLWTFFIFQDWYQSNYK